MENIENILPFILESIENNFTFIENLNIDQKLKCFAKYDFYFGIKDNEYINENTIINICNKHILNCDKSTLNEIINIFDKYDIEEINSLRLELNKKINLWRDKQFTDFLNSLDALPKAEKLTQLSNTITEINRSIFLAEYNDAQKSNLSFWHRQKQICEAEYNLIKDQISFDSSYNQNPTTVTEQQIYNKSLSPIKLSSILSESKIIFLNQMLEDLSITKDGKSIINERKSALRGIVEACLEKGILPQIGIGKLNKLIAAEINLELKARLDESNISNDVKKAAIEYIKNYYKS